MNSFKTEGLCNTIDTIECVFFWRHTLSVTVNTSTVKTRVPKVQFPNICKEREEEECEWPQQSACIHGLVNILRFYSAYMTPNRGSEGGDLFGERSSFLGPIN